MPYVLYRVLVNEALFNEGRHHFIVVVIVSFSCSHSISKAKSVADFATSTPGSVYIHWAGYMGMVRARYIFKKTTQMPMHMIIRPVYSVILNLRLSYYNSYYYYCRCCYYYQV